MQCLRGRDLAGVGDRDNNTEQFQSYLLELVWDRVKMSSTAVLAARKERLDERERVDNIISVIMRLKYLIVEYYCNLINSMHALRNRIVIVISESIER